MGNAGWSACAWAASKQPHENHEPKMLHRGRPVFITLLSIRPRGFGPNEVARHAGCTLNLGLSAGRDPPLSLPISGMRPHSRRCAKLNVSSSVFRQLVLFFHRWSSLWGFAVRLAIQHFSRRTGHLCRRRDRGGARNVWPGPAARFKSELAVYRWYLARSCNHGTRRSAQAKSFVPLTAFR